MAALPSGQSEYMLYKKGLFAFAGNRVRNPFLILALDFENLIFCHRHSRGKTQGNPGIGEDHGIAFQITLKQVQAQERQNGRQKNFEENDKIRHGFGVVS